MEDLTCGAVQGDVRPSSMIEMRWAEYYKHRSNIKSTVYMLLNDTVLFLFLGGFPLQEVKRLNLAWKITQK